MRQVNRKKTPAPSDFTQRMRLIFPELGKEDIVTAIRSNKEYAFDERTIEKWYSGEGAPPVGEKRIKLNKAFKEIRSDYVPAMLGEPSGRRSRCR